MLFAFLAGLLTVLSPCVLPLLPIILTAASGEHRFGPVALAGGLALSFTGLGLLLSVVASTFDIDTGVFRQAGAILIIALGAVLMLPAWQTQLATAGGSVSSWAEQMFGGFDTGGLRGQFLLGLLLGAVWSPCVGPTLGAASMLAAQGRDLGIVGLTMLIFGAGAAIPLILLGLVSRELMTRWRQRLMLLGKSGKAVLGALLVVVGLGVLTGFDKATESLLVEWSPDWLTQLTTRF